MTAAIAHQPTRTVPGTATLEVRVFGRTVRAIIAAAEVVAELPLHDPRWGILGRQLTAVVHVARLDAGVPGSPIRPGEMVAPVLRLRDLGRPVGIVATSDALATPKAEAGLGSLQAAAASC